MIDVAVVRISTSTTDTIESMFLTIKPLTPLKTKSLTEGGLQARAGAVIHDAPAGFTLRHAYTYINHGEEVDEEISWRSIMTTTGQAYLSWEPTLIVRDPDQ